MRFHNFMNNSWFRKITYQLHAAKRMKFIKISKPNRRNGQRNSAD